MIINNLNLISAALAPYDTKQPLIIDPDAMLTLAVTTKFLQTIRWRNA
jgi:hypothetical protein